MMNGSWTALSLIYSVIFIIWKALKEARDGSSGEGLRRWGKFCVLGY